MKKMIVALTLVLIVNVSLAGEKEQIRLSVKKDYQVGIYLEFRWVFEDSIPANLLSVLEKDEQLHKFVKETIAKGQVIFPRDLRGHQTWYPNSAKVFSPSQVVFSYLNGERKEVWLDMQWAPAIESFFKPADDFRNFKYGPLAFSWNETGLSVCNVEWTGVPINGDQKSEKFTVCLTQSVKPRKNQPLFSPDKSLFFRKVQSDQLKVSGIEMEFGTCCAYRDEISAQNLDKNGIYGSVSYCLGGNRLQRAVDEVRRRISELKYPLFFEGEVQESQEGEIREKDWKSVRVVLELEPGEE